MTARVLGATDGNAGQLGSIGVRFMLSGDDTGGGLALVEHPMPLGHWPRHYTVTAVRTSTASSSRAGSEHSSATRSSTERRAPDLQATQTVAHVLERRHRAGPNPRAHLAGGIRTLLRGGGRALATGRPTRSKRAQGRCDTVRARSRSRQHPSPNREVRPAFRAGSRVAHPVPGPHRCDPRGHRRSEHTPTMSCQRSSARPRLLPITSLEHVT
jgi:hypothetical protein